MSEKQIPYGYCQCGCGQKTSIAKCNDKRFGHVRGEPVFYISGHGNVRPPEVRFWEKVDKRGPNECWPWRGSLDNHGYGKFHYRRGGTVGKAHAFSYILAHGDVPADMCVLHKCDNPRCVNPSHLFIGTQADNVRDMDKKGRRVAFGLSGEAHPNSILTERAVIAIRQCAAHGESPASIGRAFGVARHVVYQVIHHKTWKHVK